MNAERISLLLQCVHSRAAVLWTDLSVFFARVLSRACVCVCVLIFFCSVQLTTGGRGRAVRYLQTKPILIFSLFYLCATLRGSRRQIGVSSANTLDPIFLFPAPRLCHLPVRSPD